MDDVLQQRHLEEINNALHLLSQLVPEIEKALRAGVDVTRQQQAALHYQRRLMEIKRVYFPNSP